MNGSIVISLDEQQAKAIDWMFTSGEKYGRGLSDSLDRVIEKVLAVNPGVDVEHVQAVFGHASLDKGARLIGESMGLSDAATARMHDEIREVASKYALNVLVDMAQ